MIMKTMNNAVKAIRRMGHAYCHAYKVAAGMIYVH